MKMFSEHDDRLQVVWDSTSLGALMHCPRYYQYNILEGHRSGGVDLEFGVLIHLGKEVYNKALLAGDPWQVAQLHAVKAVFEASLPKEGEEHSWGGAYEDMWRCTGTTKYRNKKGNVAKCPWSHKGKWFQAPGPELCGECGSATETFSRYLPGHKQKHRYNLLRAIAWWAEETKDGPWNPTFLPGTTKPAVEMHFKLAFPHHNRYGEQYIFSGYLDAVKEYNGDLYWTDTKTTANSLGKYWGSQFNSNLQMSVYGWAAPKLFNEGNLRGGIIEGVQITVDGVSFGEHFVPSSLQLQDEFVHDTIYWLNQAERYAKRGYWPKNLRSCFLCPFKDVCSADPEDRQMILDGNFPVNFWDPTKERV